jgi:hypothetical protein
MSRLRVFPDTGALLAMIVFPRDRDGDPTLAGEALELYKAGTYDLVVSRVVMDELEEVIDRNFPEMRLQVVRWLAPLTERLTRRPTPKEIAAALPYSADPEDAPIFAAAAAAAPDIVLSNDFRAFHTPEAKAFWKAYNITVESLYGLLCVFGRRERKESEL